jgi:hypothetical protein
MSPPSTPRPRLIAVSAAFAVCLALAIVPVAAAPIDGVIAPGAAGVILFGAALALVQARLVPWALGLVAVEFMISLYVRDVRLDVIAALYGAGLLLAAELADWSFELGLPSRDDAGLKTRRALAIAALVVIAGGVGAVAAFAAQAPATGGLALAAAGVGAVVTLFLGLAALAWRAAAAGNQEP